MFLNTRSEKSIQPQEGDKDTEGFHTTFGYHQEKDSVENSQKTQI